MRLRVRQVTASTGPDGLVSATRPFDVSKYVLPTYSVRGRTHEGRFQPLLPCDVRDLGSWSLTNKLSAPRPRPSQVKVTPTQGYVRAGDKTITGTVAATFTSGGPVSGDLVVNLWQTQASSGGFFMPGALSARLCARAERGWAGQD